MPAPSVIRFRADPEMRRQLDRLRKEKSLNVSSWLRRLVQQGLEQEFPDYEADVATEGPEQPPAGVQDVHENDQKQVPGVATEATKTDALTTPAEGADPPQNGPNTSPSVATESLGQEGPEQPEQPPAGVQDVHENDQKQVPGVATEATKTDALTTPAEGADPPQNGPNTSPSVATESLGQEGPEQPEQPPARVEDVHGNDQKHEPGVATEATKTDALTTPAEGESLGQEGPEQPEQPPARVEDVHGNDQKHEPGVATEATKTDALTTPAEGADPPQNGPNTSPGVAAEDTVQMTPIPGWKPRKLNSGEWGAALEGEMVAELPDNEQLPGTPIVVTDKRGESWTPTLTEVVDRTDNTIVVKNSGRPRS